MSLNERVDVLTMIVAMDKNRCIGKNGGIPWSGKLRADMEHFKKTTLGKTVVMGRKTFDSIPQRYRPLPGRKNIILTRDQKYFAIGCEIMHNADEVVRRAMTEQQVFVIGGAEIYELLLPYTSRIIVTHVDAEVEGDTFFPNITGKWFPRQLFHQQKDENNEYNFTVTEYIKILEI